MLRFVIRSALAAALLLLPALAGAHPFQSFGYDPRGIAMGGAMVAEGHGPTAVWYNPALLTRDGKVEVEIGFAWARPSLTVNEPAGPEFAHDTPPDYGGYTIGLLFPLGGKVRKRLAIGVGLYLPSQNVLRTQLKDPGTPYWYVFDSSPDRIVVLPAASWKFTEWFSVGLGTHVLAGFDGGAQVEVDLLNKQVVHRELKNDLGLAQSPTAGLYFRPLPQWNLGASWRGALQLDFALPTDVILTDLGALLMDIRGVAHYTPHTFAIGTSYTFEEAAITVSGALEYQLWSQAPNPNMQLQIDLSGELVDSLGLGDSLDLGTSDVSPGFSDIFLPRIGLEYQVSERFWARGGYFLRPSFVPDQLGGTNYLDNHVHGLSAGFGFTFADPLDIFEDPLEIDLSFQRLVLRERAVKKLDGTEYVFGGHFNHLALAVVHRF